MAPTSVSSVLSASTPSVTTTPFSAKSKGKSGIPPGAIVGIVIASLAIIFIPWWIWRRRTDRFSAGRTQQPPTTSSDPHQVPPPNPETLSTVGNVMHELRLHRRPSSARPVTRLPQLPRTSSSGSDSSAIAVPTSSLYLSPLGFWLEKGKLDESLNECPICLEDINPADAVDGAPCGHRLCGACRERVIETARLKGETPLCHACRVPYES